MKSKGFFINVFGVALALIWIGIFKFTATEAAGIQPLVSNHFAMSWLYKVFSVQTVSNLFGISEIIIGILLLISLQFPKVGLYAGVAGMLVFASTLSFLFTTPNTWKVIDGVMITDFFILKDIVLLGTCYMVFEKSKITI